MVYGPTEVFPAGVIQEEEMRCVDLRIEISPGLRVVSGFIVNPSAFSYQVSMKISLIDNGECN